MKSEVLKVSLGIPGSSVIIDFESTTARSDKLQFVAAR